MIKYETDKALAEKLCKKQKSKEFEDLYVDDIYMAAKKLAYFDTNNKERSSHKTQKGYHIQVSEEVQDAASWLFERIQRYSCKYKALAPYSHFLRKDLYCRFTALNYIKYRTKNTGYIPKPIESLSSLHQRIYKHASQGKDAAFIMNRLQIDDRLTYEEGLQDVVDILSQSGLLDLIIKARHISLSPTDHISEDEKTHVEPDGELSHQEKYDFDKVMDLVSSIVSDITNEERRLLMLYWGYNKKPKAILDLFNSSKNFDIYLDFFKINAESDVSKAIDNVQYKLLKKWKDINNDQTDKKVFRAILKHYIIMINTERVDGVEL